MAINTLFMVVGVVLIFAIGLFIFVLTSYKHTIIIRRVVQNKKVIERKRFKEVTDKDGIIWFKIYGKGNIKPATPDLIDVDSKGRMWVEAHLTPEGDLHYIRDNHNDFGKDLEALDTTQRALLVAHIRKASELKGFDWKSNIVTITALGSLVVIVVCLFIFYGDIAKPVLEMGDKLVKYEQINLDILNRIEEIHTNTQRIGEAVGVKNISQVPN